MPMLYPEHELSVQRIEISDTLCDHTEEKHQYEDHDQHREKREYQKQDILGA